MKSPIELVVGAPPLVDVLLEYGGGVALADVGSDPVIALELEFPVPLIGALLTV